MELEELLTTKEAGDLLDLSVDRVRDLVKEGRLRAIPTRLGALYDPKEVERLAKEREGGRQ